MRLSVTGRPDSTLIRIFDEMSHDIYATTALQSVPIASDTVHLLEHDFATLAGDDSGWPGDEVIRTLAERSKGLFIWAATATCYIKDGHRFAKRRLDILLADQKKRETGPEETLYQIHDTVLRNALPSTLSASEASEMRERLVCLLGAILVVFTALSVACLADLFQGDRKETRGLLATLSAVLEMSNDDSEPMRLHHPSFRDYITSPPSTSEIRITIVQSAMHRTVAEACITLLQGVLKKDIAQIRWLHSAIWSYLDLELESGSYGKLKVANQ